MRTGALVAGRYRLDRLVAAGGMGQVWQATDQVLQRQVAVKLLHPEYAAHPETLRRFRSEARHTASLTHPCIAQVHDYGDSDSHGSPYLVMEFVDGPSLFTVLTAGPLSPAYAVEVTGQVAAGLAAAHRAGLIHRDIKPANILLGPEGQVKITDFGIAHVAGSTSPTDPRMVIGTSQYMAPERITGASSGPASDLYSLGIVLYECLTGVPPFTGNPAEVMAGHLHQPLPPLPPEVPPGVRDLVTRLTAKDPAQRLADAGALAAIAYQLYAALSAGEQPAPAAADPDLADLPSPLLPGPARPTEERHRAGWTAVLTALLLVVLSVAGLEIYTHAHSGTPQSTSAATSTPHDTAPSTAEPAPTVQPTAQLLTPAKAEAFGPAGTSDGDNQNTAASALRTGKGWSSEWYASAAFGNLQKGTGLLVDMGAVVSITSVSAQLGQLPGATIDLEVGDEPVMAALHTVKQVTNAGKQVMLQFPPVKARYLLIWYTQLPPDGSGSYQADIADLLVRGYR